MSETLEMIPPPHPEENEALAERLSGIIDRFKMMVSAGCLDEAYEMIGNYCEIGSPTDADGLFVVKPRGSGFSPREQEILKHIRERAEETNWQVADSPPNAESHGMPVVLASVQLLLFCFELVVSKSKSVTHHLRVVNLVD